MPIPKPGADEDEKKFIARCMGDEVMNTEFPDQEQRSAVCYRQFRKESEGADSVPLLFVDSEKVLAQLPAS